MANYDVKETTIQGRRYTLPVMPSVKGRKVLLRLMKVCGPLADMPSDRDSGGKSIGEIAVQILGTLDSNDFDWILRNLVEGAMVSGEGPDTMLQLSRDDTQNIVWCDNDGYLAMFEFIQWALECNFQGFINGLREKFKSRKKGSPAASQAAQ